MTAAEAAERCARAIAALDEAMDRSARERAQFWAALVAPEFKAAEPRVPPYVWTVDPAEQDRKVTERILDEHWAQRSEAA